MGARLSTVVDIFVSEYLCSGACREEPPASSLFTEGRAMWQAVLADFARHPNCRVVTTCDAHLPCSVDDSIRIVRIAEPDQEWRTFFRLAAECDATFLIAPEWDGILAARRRWVDEAGGRFLGCSAEAIELCADKWRLARHCREAGIPTVATHLFSERQTHEDFRCRPFPRVLKLRDGAGSHNVMRVDTAAELTRAVQQLQEAGYRDEQILEQPFLAGEAISVAVLISPQSNDLAFCPPARQRLSADGFFSYLGGDIPWPSRWDRVIQQRVTAVCRSLPGLAGYVGFDWILPKQSREEPVLMEINPRLTTSYLGYRQLAEDNLAGRLLFSRHGSDAISWRSGCVSFHADGTVHHRLET